MCWLRRMEWITLFWVLAMLVVESSCFALCFPFRIIHPNYLPRSLRLCWIRGTYQIRLLGVHSFIVGSSFRWWCPRYIVCGLIFSWLVDQWQFRCTDQSQTMMARVDPSLQEVKSRQVITPHSWIMGDIVDSEPRVGSRRIISFCRYST